MKRAIGILSGLLAVQLILIVLVNLGRQDLTAFSSSEQVLGVTAADFDRLLIQEQDGSALELRLKDGVWRLPSKSDFPAAPDKSKEFIGRLVALTRSWPVARTGIAAKQLKVTADAFERKLVLSKGEAPVKTLYLGTTPGFKRVHARVEGEDPVYAVDLNAYDAGTKVEDWMDYGALGTGREKIVGMEIGGVALESADGQFRVVGLSDAEETNEGEVNSLIAKVTGLRFDELLGTEDKAEYNLVKPAIEFALRTVDGGTITYQFGKPAAGETYIAKSSALPYYFRVSAATAEGFKDIKRAALVREKTAAEPEASASPAASGEGGAGGGKQSQ